MTECDRRRSSPRRRSGTRRHSAVGARAHRRRQAGASSPPLRDRRGRRGPTGTRHPRRAAEDRGRDGRRRSATWMNRRLRSGLRRALKPAREPYATHTETLLEKAKDVQAVFVATPTPPAPPTIAVEALASRASTSTAKRRWRVTDRGLPRRSSRPARGTEVASSRPGCWAAPTRSTPAALLRALRRRARSDLDAGAVSTARPPGGRRPPTPRARERALNWRSTRRSRSVWPGEFGTQQFDVIHWFIGAATRCRCTRQRQRAGLG